MSRQLLAATEDIENVDDFVGVPLSAALIQAKAYYEEKAQPLSTQMKMALSLHFDADHIENVRVVYDADGGNIAGLLNGIREVMGDIKDGNHAVAIDNIIVFAKKPDGLKDLFFYAHEVQHTIQYAEKGIVGFAADYTKNYKKLEADADQAALKTVQAFRTLMGLSPLEVAAAE